MNNCLLPLHLITASISDVLEITTLCPITAFAIVPVFLRFNVIFLQIFGTAISFTLNDMAAMASTFTSQAPAKATLANIADTIPVEIKFFSSLAFSSSLV
jgi:hypothetical protein